MTSSHKDQQQEEGIEVVSSSSHLEKENLDNLKLSTVAHQDSTTALPSNSRQSSANITSSSQHLLLDKEESQLLQTQMEEEKLLVEENNSQELDLSNIRGIAAPEEDLKEKEELEALAELVPGLKQGKVGKDAVHDSPDKHEPIPHLDSMAVNQGLEEEYEKDREAETLQKLNALVEGNEEDDDDESSDDDNSDESDEKTTSDLIKSYEQKPINGQGLEASASSDSSAGKTHASKEHLKKSAVLDKVNPIVERPKSGPSSAANPTPYHTDLADQYHQDGANEESSFYLADQDQSVASLTTATNSQSHVRMPMYLPNFRPATGCTNASDFIVRCFVARLRAGITVVKHGRSRWCKSRLRVLHVHSDGRSLSWRPAQGEPTSNKRPPKLDLSTCLEVRHAWSPDPLNPMFTGTPILRSKCEASNAFKSFALIFPRRTVDITAVTADQCKVLMEGFSALCFRLQVANMAGRTMGSVGDTGAPNATDEDKGGEGGGKTERTAPSTMR